MVRKERLKVKYCSLYIYFERLISARVPAELVCDLLDCFILLCNLILPSAPVSGCHVTCLDQSESSIQVTWSVLTNHRVWVSDRQRVRYGISDPDKVQCSQMQQKLIEAPRYNRVANSHSATVLGLGMASVTSESGDYQVKLSSSRLWLTTSCSWAQFWAWH